MMLCCSPEQVALQFQAHTVLIWYEVKYYLHRLRSHPSPSWYSCVLPLAVIPQQLPGYCNHCKPAFMFNPTPNLRFVLTVPRAIYNKLSMTIKVNLR